MVKTCKHEWSRIELIELFDRQQPTQLSAPHCYILYFEQSSPKIFNTTKCCSGHIYAYLINSYKTGVFFFLLLFFHISPLPRRFSCRVYSIQKFDRNANFASLQNVYCIYSNSYSCVLAKLFECLGTCKTYLGWTLNEVFKLLALIPFTLKTWFTNQCYAYEKAFQREMRTLQCRGAELLSSYFLNSRQAIYQWRHTSMYELFKMLNVQFDLTGMFPLKPRFKLSAVRSLMWGDTSLAACMLQVGLGKLFVVIKFWFFFFYSCVRTFNGNIDLSLRGHGGLRKGNTRWRMSILCLNAESQAAEYHVSRVGKKNILVCATRFSFRSADQIFSSDNNDCFYLHSPDPLIISRSFLRPSYRSSLLVSSIEPDNQLQTSQTCIRN